eukprot:1279469-Pleurochrysis_carterae.AAC.1
MFTKRQSKRMLAKNRSPNGYMKEKEEEKRAKPGGIDGASNRVQKLRVTVVWGQKEKTSGCGQVRVSECE